MQCIFCKEFSENTISIEHIIPESLGNTTRVLPKGMVCDKCNNYLSRKIEQPFFEQEEIKLLRFYEGIPNKRGKVPPVEIIMNEQRINLERKISGRPFPSNNELLHFHDDNAKIENFYIKAYTDSNLLIPSRVVSRFIAKIAFESLAVRIENDPDWDDYILNSPQFNTIRNYIRYNKGDTWKYRVRRIYNINSNHLFPNGETYQFVHEEDFLLIRESEYQDDNSNDMIYGHMYFVIALWGLEFVINLVDNSDDGLIAYDEWLKNHNYISFLHYGKNDTSSEIKEVF